MKIAIATQSIVAGLDALITESSGIPCERDTTNAAFITAAHVRSTEGERKCRGSESQPRLSSSL